MLTWDETVYFPTYDLLHGFEIGPVFVGGAHPTHSLLKVQPDAIPEMPQESLAQVTVSFCIKGITSRSQCWDIQMMPRKMKEVTAEVQFQQVGNVLLLCARGNAGLPPACIAYDGHPTHVQINAAFLGCLPRLSMSSADFFSQCELNPDRRLPCFSFRSLSFCKQHTVFACLDVPHVQKAAVRNGRTSIRKLSVGCGLFVSFECLLLGSLPRKAFCGKDDQSDREAAWMLTPTSKPTWDDLGVSLWQYILALVTSPWSSHQLFSHAECLENAFCGVLLNVP